jgi:hypothetical protein
MAIVSCVRADGIAISDGDAMAAVCTFMNVLLSTAGSPLALDHAHDDQGGSPADETYSKRLVVMRLGGRIGMDLSTGLLNGPDAGHN